MGAAGSRLYDPPVDEIAIIATISGAAVAVAGIIANAYVASVQRRQALELAEKNHAHERELASGARLFDRRGAVYEEMLGLLYLWMERVDRPEPIISFKGEPEPPEPPGRKEGTTCSSGCAPLAQMPWRTRTRISLMLSAPSISKSRTYN
jgi:hypothetical protein